jgi:hypothetical protein
MKRATVAAWLAFCIYCLPGARARFVCTGTGRFALTLA